MALLLALLALAPGVLAQETETDSTPTFGSVTLNGNFVLDPFLITVIGGGSAAAADLAPGCAGFVPAEPTLMLTLTGEPTESLRVFAYSDADPVLVVRTPAGELLCNDDTSARVVDPTVELDSAEAGEYAIWLGMYEQNQLAPAFLVLTHSEAITASIFSLASLVQRVPAGDLEANLTAELEANLQAQIDAGLRQTLGAELTSTLDPAADPMTFEEVQGGGDILALETDSRGFQCAGFIGTQPTLRLTVPEGTALMGVVFESTSDSTLVIVAPNGDVFCNDDVATGNLNPGILIPSPAAGDFAIYVGAFDPAITATGRLRVGGTSELDAALLEAPPAPDAGE
jgi:hypothetical protein